MRLRSSFGTAVGRAWATGLRAMAGFVSFAARATARLAMRLFAPNLRTFRARTGFTKVVPRTPLRTAGLWAFWAVTLAESWARALRTAVWWLRATSLRTAGLRTFWAVTLAESWARALRTAVWWLMRATSLRTAGLWALRAALLRSCLPFAFFDRLFHAFAPFLAGLLIFLVTLGGFSTTVVIMVAVTMMAPFVVIVVATPMMAISITIMIPTAVLVAIVIQYILLAGEGGFATFFAGAAFALAFAARALAGPAFSFTSWTLPRTSLRDSSHFLQFLGLFFSEDGSYFLLVFFAESAESLTNPLAVFVFPGFSHQFAKGGTLFGLKLFHLLSLFFVKAKCLG